MEIKAGGNLDSSNAQSNAKKLLTIYTGLNYRKTKPYFATIYLKMEKVELGQVLSRSIYSIHICSWLVLQLEAAHSIFFYFTFIILKSFVCCIKVLFSISIPIKSLFNLQAAIPVEPTPINGASMVFPSFDADYMLKCL